MSTPRRPGFYVEERYFGAKEAQAKAFAQHRANTFSRDVQVMNCATSMSSPKVAYTARHARKVA